ncbi:hypothetical protein NA57DRAFT_74163 [Rhizodiscina lignyota]|uniref:Uncharacterized protein n=1 Tax=Rhizodiscina lignyota TaxID=1504668 RepID=A0A9P4M7L4_9PEZI|nr:hypothetical protein NA57DRAFT_74163 [Rhizodiscina lignyota]
MIPLSQQGRYCLLAFLVCGATVWLGPQFALTEEEETQPAWFEVLDWGVRAVHQWSLCKSEFKDAARCLFGQCQEHEASKSYAWLLAVLLQIPNMYAVFVRHGWRHPSTWEWIRRGIFPVHIRLAFVLLVASNWIRSMIMHSELLAASLKATRSSLSRYVLAGLAVGVEVALLPRFIQPVILEWFFLPEAILNLNDWRNIGWMNAAACLLLLQLDLHFWIAVTYEVEQCVKHYRDKIFDQKRRGFDFRSTAPEIDRAEKEKQPSNSACDTTKKDQSTDEPVQLRNPQPVDK